MTFALEAWWTARWPPMISNCEPAAADFRNSLSIAFRSDADSRAPSRSCPDAATAANVTLPTSNRATTVANHLILIRSPSLLPAPTVVRLPTRIGHGHAEGDGSLGGDGANGRGATARFSVRCSTRAASSL